jgi:hypothetical protein
MARGIATKNNTMPMVRHQDSANRMADTPAAHISTARIRRKTAMGRLMSEG